MKYVLVSNDQADSDRDRLYLSYSRHNPEYAGRWDKGLQDALDGLTDFPGPLAWAVDEEASALYQQEVRRCLYYGPTLRRTGKPVRILFSVLPPDPSEPEDDGESVILLLRLLHVAQLLLPDDAGDAPNAPPAGQN